MLQCVKTRDDNFPNWKRFQTFHNWKLLLGSVRIWGQPGAGKCV